MPTRLRAGPKNLNRTVMKKLHFTKDIKAPAKKVYNTMLGIENIKTYEAWTTAFQPGSTYEGSWNKGSKMLFVGPDGEGGRAGMVARIAENKPHQFVSIHHYGLVSGDKEITEGPEVEQWAGAHENYTFKESNGTTTVTIDIDVADAFVDMFGTMWPNALNKLQTLVEG